MQALYKVRQSGAGDVQSEKAMSSAGVLQFVQVMVGAGVVQGVKVMSSAGFLQYVQVMVGTGIGTNYEQVSLLKKLKR